MALRSRLDIDVQRVLRALATGQSKRQPYPLRLQNPEGETWREAPSLPGASFVSSVALHIKVAEPIKDVTSRWVRSTSGNVTQAARKESHVRRGAIVQGGCHAVHGLKALLNLGNVMNVPGILGLAHAAEHVFDSLAVVHPLVQERLCRYLGFLRRGALLGSLAAGVGLGVGSISLTLASLGWLRSGRCSWRRATGASVVVVDALHVVLEVPLSRESISRQAALATVILAKERLLAVAMESVGLTLMSKKAGSGRETSSLASVGLASIWLEVRVDKFAILMLGGGTGQPRIEMADLLVVALQLLGLVVAARLSLPRAVVESILARAGVLVQIMAPSRLTISARCESWC